MGVKSSTFATVLVLAFTFHSVGSILLLGELSTIFEISQKIGEMWDFNKKDPGNEEVLDGMKEILTEMKRTETQIRQSNTEGLASLRQNFEKMLDLKLVMQKIKDSVERINVAGERLNRYLKHINLHTNSSTFEIETLKDFAYSAISHYPGSVLSDRDYLHNHMKSQSTGDENILFKLEESMKGGMKENCHLKRSPQQTIFIFYQFIALAQAKGYAITQYAWMLLRTIDGKNFTKEIELDQRTYNEQREEILKQVKTIIGKAGRELLKCDPHETKSYAQIMGLVRGHVQNDGDMASDNSCYYDCHNYKIASSRGYYDDRVQGHLPLCQGTIRDCKYIESDMKICLNDQNQYDYIRFSSGKQWGESSGYCTPLNVHSWWRGWYHCSYCYCMCTDSTDSTSNRYFSLQVSRADTNRNMVITGVQLVIEDNMVQFHIQQGKLQPQGGIDPKTIGMKRAQSLNRIYGQKNSDYFSLSWDDNRDMILDDCESSEGYVVTGVGFDSLGNLAMKVEFSEMDFETGTLTGKKYEQVCRVSQRHLSTEHADVPTKTTSEFYSEPHQTVRFTHTGHECDASQSTVPFLDTQLVHVSPDSPVPLAGIGLFLKGAYKSGGFIAPKIMTYNFSPHLEASPTQ